MSALVGSTAVTSTALACGLMAGVYFAFSGFVMQSLGAVEGRVGMAAMQSINRVILTSSFMPLFWLSTVASLLLAAWGAGHWTAPGSPFLVAAGSLYVIGMFVCTAAGNVPLNQALDALDPGTPQALAVWREYLVRWTRYNHIRSVAAAASSALFLLAARTL